ncbi:MAG TPA: OmpA family protein, partial [Bacteroidota bacterium]|nr:OmpA family protein [Bacteroidota bacterium]
LPRNAAKKYSLNTAYVPAGIGLQYLLEKNTAIELSGAYHYTLTRNLSDVLSPSNNSYWTISVNLFGYFNRGPIDSDGDGLTDDEEAILGTDPHNPDTDGDGLSDYDEVKIYHTDPLKKDTDGDGLTDYEEVKIYHTDPLNKDTDGDGLTDGDEVHIYHTDPLKRDTDGGGVPDGEEVRRGTNPLDPSDDFPKKKEEPPPPPPVVKKVDSTNTDISRVEKGQHIAFHSITFESAKATLAPSSIPILDSIAADLNANPDIEVQIEGHTDNRGSSNANMVLSINRAKVVKSYLMSKGISAKRLTTKGYGSTKPVADNSTAEGRTTNRRIEFVRTK